MEVQFRPMAFTDIDVLVSMMEQFYAIDNYSIDIECSKNMFREFITHDYLGRGWLIMNDQVPVGYTIVTFYFSFEYKGRIAFLDELYISKREQGKGFGQKALDFLMKELKKLSLKLVYLEVEKHNEKAKKLYYKNGFSLHHREFMKRLITY